MSIEARFAQTISDDALLGRDEPLIAGVSGGADSVALLHLLYSMNEREGWSIRPHVAHLDHQLRGEASRGDAEFVRELARGLKLSCTVESVDVRERARTEGVSLEQAGRAARFEFFERLCLRQDIKVVALGHHADDNAETVLQRIIRGTGIRGLSGIQSNRPIRPGSDIRLLRPMLHLRRSEIEEYLSEKNLSFRRDASNLSDEFMRNRVRNQLLPMLRKQFNPQVDEALVRLAEQCRGVNEYIVEVGEHILEAALIRQDAGQIVLDGVALAKKPRVIRAQVVRQALARLGIGEGAIGFTHLNAVAALAEERTGSKVLELPGARITRHYSELAIERSAGAAEGLSALPEIGITINATTLLPDYHFELTVEEFEADAGDIRDYLRLQEKRGQLSYQEWLDAATVHPPLSLRPWHAGDQFQPLGMSGVKKLSDFFIDEKIDANARQRTPLLHDQIGPIWVMPFRIEHRVRLTDATRRVLRLRARPLNQENPTPDAF